MCDIVNVVLYFFKVKVNIKCKLVLRDVMIMEVFLFIGVYWMFVGFVVENFIKSSFVFGCDKMIWFGCFYDNVIFVCLWI